MNGWVQLNKNQTKLNYFKMHENIDERNQEMLRSLRDEIWFLIDNSTFDEIWRFEKSRNLDEYNWKELIKLKVVLKEHQIGMDPIAEGLNYNMSDIKKKLDDIMNDPKK
jgi:hypothetical protein